MALTEELKESDILVIAVTGYANKLNLPTREFFEEAGLKNVSKITISDKTKLQTLAGLPPEFPAFSNLVTYLIKLIDKYKYKQVITTGTSGGAHTALLLGHLLKANYVVAFAPYPYLSIQEVKRLNDPVLKTNPRILAQFDKLPQESKKYKDLRPILMEWNGRTEYFIHVSRYNNFDYKRALYLYGLSHVHIISHAFEEHAVAGVLARMGKLKSCFLFPFKTALYNNILMHIRFANFEIIQRTKNLTKCYSATRKRRTRLSVIAKFKDSRLKWRI